MDRLRRSICVLAIMVCTMYNSNAQNPIWTIPGYQYAPGVSYTLIPQSPIDPSTLLPETDAFYAYQGDPSENVSASYSDEDGNLMFFTIDGNLYDSKGWVVGALRKYYDAPIPANYIKRGHSEQLILPMGKSCTKFAILYTGGRDMVGGSSGTDKFSTGNPPSRQRLYMATYDIEANNPFNANAEGSLVGLTANPNTSNTLEDISAQAFLEEGANLWQSGTITHIYGYKLHEHYFDGSQVINENIQSNGSQIVLIAATGLIDEGETEGTCHMLVFVFDGQNVIRYKLSADGLEWDGLIYTDLNLTPYGYVRSEMELISLANGNYRLAFPALLSNSGNQQSLIRIIDTDPSGDYISGSAQTISLPGSGPTKTDVYGMEFNETGSHLYFTHKHHSSLPGPLNVWNIQTAQLVSNLPVLSGIGDFRESYIERFGSDLYVASDDYLGLLTNVNTPSSLSFNNTFQAIQPGYGNTANTGDTDKFRYLLPDQLDMDYPDLTEMSCECCSKLGSDALVYTANGTQTWTPLQNPFNNGTGAEVRIYDELRIAPGANITIDGMIFKFGPEARVVVQKGNGTANGGILKLRNSTVFTADLTCKDGNEFISCGEPDDDEACDRDFWQGIVVEGKSNLTQSISGTTQQGRLIMETNSMVEYARTAVLVGNTSNTTDGGGVLRISDSRFKDNINGIYFRPYLRMSGGQELYTLSDIRMSDFYTTSDFLTLSPATPGRFLDVRGISGLYIYANTFENQVPSSFGFSQRGTGMYISDSRVQDKWFCTGSILQGCVGGTINRSMYKNLTLGIDGINTTSIRTVFIYHAIFQNNFTNGIRLSKYQNPEILDNDFYIGWYAGIGLSMTGCTGYEVENNTFQDFQGGLYGRGIVVQDSGEAPNEIYRNTFTSLAQGIVTQGENADEDNLDIGLEILCNTFDQPVRNHDIYLASGSISDDQGNCNGQTSGPAGNLFSHSHTSYVSHYDWRVNTSLVLSGLEVVYRHHSPLSTPTELRLKPIVYTPGPPDYIQPVACTIAYGGYATSCPVKNTSMQYGITGGPKSNDISEETIFTPEYISAQAAELDAAINEAEAYLDGGNTWQLLSLIASGGETDEIAALVEEAGESISATVINRLQKTGDEELSILATSALEGLDMASSTGTIGDTGEESALNIELPSSSIEAAWKTNRMTRDALWTDATRAAMSDTLGNLLPNDILELANVHHPKTIGQYVASVALSLDEAVPSWISDQDDPFFTNFGSVSLPSTGESDSLPSDIPDHFIQSSFAFNGNLTAINEMYVAKGQSYNVYTIPFEEVDLGKSNNAKAQKDGKAVDTERISVLPNPFENHLVFKLSNIDEPIGVVRIELFDLLGRKVFSQEFGGDSHTLIIHDARIPKGVLMYVVFTDDKPLQNGKIIKM